MTTCRWTYVGRSNGLVMSANLEMISLPWSKKNLSTLLTLDRAVAHSLNLSAELRYLRKHMINASKVSIWSMAKSRLKPRKALKLRTHCVIKLT